MVRCIYCGSSGPFHKEHPLPACLGEFQGAPILLDRVCKDCNEDIGRAEEQFCRASPQALLRYYFGVEGRKTHEKVNPFRRGSAGGGPIDFVAPLPENDIAVLWELTKGEPEAREIPQIVLIDDNGNPHQIRVQQWMKESEQLQEQIRKLGVNVRRAYVFAGDDEKEAIQSLIAGMGWSVSWFSQPEGAIIDGAVARIQVTTSYFRALAKIGFHHLLALKPELSGEEPEFEHVKQFIRHGMGNTDSFFHEQPGCLLARPSPDQRTDRTVHIIVAEWRDGYVETRMQFFFGPKGEPHVYRVSLGQNVRALSGRGGEGYCYAYFTGGPQGKWAGDVSKLAV